jgi:hypothetical protein
MEWGLFSLSSQISGGASLLRRRRSCLGCVASPGGSESFLRNLPQHFLPIGI